MRWSLLVLVLGLSGCTGLFFFPNRTYVRTPEQLGLAYENVRLESSDDVGLQAWYLPATGRACATILFLHGNAQNISTHIASVYWLPERGFNVFMLDYRGYGASDGTPSLAGSQDDIDAAMRHLMQRRDIDAARIVIFGQSLGAAAALYYVAHTQYRDSIRAVVAESAFASHRQIAREKFGAFWLTWPLQWPLAMTVDDDYSPIGAIQRIAPIPLLLVHGEGDPVVPVEHSEQLYDGARGPKELWEVPDAGHIGAFRFPALRNRLVTYLREKSCPSELTVRSRPSVDTQTP